MEATSTQLFTQPPNARMMILRGVVSVAFGILALLWPAPGLLAIAMIFGIYALANGITTMATGVRRGKEGRSWGLLVFEGILGIGAAAVTLFWPGITLFVLSFFVGIWALAVGVLEIIGAFQLTRLFANVTTGGRVLMGIVGLLSIALGAAIFVYPGLGTVTLLTLVAAYALISGAVMIGLGFQANRMNRNRQEPPEIHEIPRAA